MTQYTSHVSQSATTIYVKSASGFDDDTTFGSSPANNHEVTGTVRFANRVFIENQNLYVTADAEINQDLTVDSTIYGSRVSIGPNNSTPLVNLEIHHTGTKDPTNLFAGNGGGEFVYFGTGSLTFGKIYYLNSDGGWDAVNANGTGSLGSSSAGNQSILGIAHGSNPATSGLMIRGWWNLNGASPYFTGSWVTGSAVYIYSGSAADAGRLTATAPTGAGAYVRIVGYCTDTPNVIYFDPDKTWVEIS